jgi:hypothetical protein
MYPEVPVVVLVLPKVVALRPPTKPAFVPEFDWVVGCKPAELPEFCCPPPAPRGAKVTFGFVLPMFPLVAVMGIFPGVVVFALAFALVATVAVAAAEASTFGGGRVEVCNIIVLLGKIWVG